MGCYRGGDDPAPALAYLDRARQLPLVERDRSQAHFFRGTAFRSLEDEDRAQGEFRHAVAADPSFPPPHMTMMAPETVPVEAVRQAGR
jgi:Tfp pilus assembly protein PilF